MKLRFPVVHSDVRGDLDLETMAMARVAFFHPIQTHMTHKWMFPSNAWSCARDDFASAFADKYVGIGRLGLCGNKLPCTARSSRSGGLQPRFRIGPSRGGVTCGSES